MTSDLTPDKGSGKQAESRPGRGIAAMATLGFLDHGAERVGIAIGVEATPAGERLIEVLVEQCREVGARMREHLAVEPVRLALARQACERARMRELRPHVGV